jgi:hypothetical protein
LLQFSSAFGGVPASNSEDPIKLSISNSIVQLIEDTAKHERRMKRQQIKIEEEKKQVKVEQPIKEEKPQEFACLVCLEAFTEDGEVYPLESCEHICHTQCLKIYLKFEIEMGKCPMICPAENCNKVLIENDIKQLIDKESMEKYHKYVLNLSLEQQKDISCCPSIRCNYVFVVGDKGNGIFRCP